jgi:TctA family transporter
MEYLVLLLAPFIGILIGFIPALGATMAMLLLYPLLGKLDVHLIIIFYAVIISCKEFSGSVSAICFNLLGEINQCSCNKGTQIYS